MSEQNYTAAEASRRRRSCSRWMPPPHCCRWRAQVKQMLLLAHHGSASYHRCTDKIGPRVKMYLSAGELATSKRKWMRRRNKKKKTRMLCGLCVNDVSRCWQSLSAVAVGHDSVAARTTTTTTRLPSLIPRIEQQRASERQENSPTRASAEDGKREEAIFPLSE